MLCHMRPTDGREDNQNQITQSSHSLCGIKAIGRYTMTTLLQALQQTHKYTWPSFAT
jgi:hypothetical protein